MSLKMSKVHALVCLGLIFVNVSCGGDKDSKKTEDVNVKDLAWVDKNSTLKPGRSIGVQGEVLSNTNSVVDFTIADAQSKEVKLDANALSVSSQNPPSGKNAFSLRKDMDVQVVAGAQACNGEYVLNVKVKAGRSNIVKPLYFKVVEAKECKDSLGLEVGSRKGSIHNALGPKESAFDLVSGRLVAKTEGDANKDLVDLTNIGSRTARGGFRKTLNSGNHARFHVNNSFGYNNVTADVASELFADNRGERATPPLKVNDIVFVKLNENRDNGAIYVLKITRVDDTSFPSERGTNGGVIEFEYKKVK